MYYALDLIAVNEVLRYRYLIRDAILVTTGPFSPAFEGVYYSARHLQKIDKGIFPLNEHKFFLAPHNPYDAAATDPRSVTVDLGPNPTVTIS